jgi:signal transduction histidine kinase
MGRTFGSVATVAVILALAVLVINGLASHRTVEQLVTSSLATVVAIGYVVFALVLLYRDLTAWRRAAADKEQLARSKRLLLESTGEGIYGVDLQGNCTFLNAVILYSELLQEEAEDHGVAEFIPDLEKIRAAGKHLLALVNGVLDLSKIEAGKMELYLLFRDRNKR